MRLFPAKTKLYTNLVARRSLSSAGKGSRFDITHRSHVARDSSPQKDINARAWKPRGAFTRLDRSFEVFEVSKAGGLKRTSITLANVLRNFGVHARDVLSLGLQDERYHPPPAVLPREGVVVVALGPFKALVHTEACVLFEAEKIDVSYIAPILADLVQANNEVPPSEDVWNPATWTPPRPPSSAAAVAGDEKNGDGSKATLGGDGPNARGEEDGAAAAAAAVGSRRPAATAAAAATGGGGNNSGSPETRLGLQPSAGAPQTPTAAARTREEGDESVADKLAAKVGDYVQEAFRFGAGVASSEELWGKDPDKDAAALQEEGEEDEEEEEEEEHHQMKVMFREQLPMPFELAMLEVMLQEVCTSYHRRAHVVRRLMEQGLQPSETTSFFAPSRIEHYRLVPLKLAIKQLELKLSQTRACLEELMQSDEDMLGLLLTEAKELRNGEMLDAHRHSVVELLLENYHRQLVLVGHDVAAMKQEMESLQELSAISLDVNLNSMIAVDVRLAMLNLGVATSACIFGAMGMNTTNGLESSHVAFYCLLGGSAAASAMALGGVMRHLRSVVRAGDSQQGKLMALNTICDHVDDIESVLRLELEFGQKTAAGAIKRDAMARKLARTRGKEISEEELDLIFAVFDTSGDGCIDTKEYGKLVSEPAGSLGSSSGAAAGTILPSRDGSN